MNIVIEKKGDYYVPADTRMLSAFTHFSGGLGALLERQIQELTDIAALHGCTVTIKGA